MRPRRDESGFALILAILALMLLTFLGLTLAQTTSIELQIATNYRNAQQALYNAEAGLEVGKRAIRWEAAGGGGGGAGGLVPPPRPVGPSMLNPPSWSQIRNGHSGEPTRNFENKDCDGVAHQGFGVVLDTRNTDYPYQNVYQQLGQSLQGTFTIWVRRQTLYDPGANPYDEPRNDRLIMTVEGTAPYQVAGTNFTQRGRAVRMLEAAFLISGPCSKQGGQPEDKPGCAPVG